MTIRLIIGAVGIWLGLMALFATDQVWLMVQRVNALLGREVKRTERWNARAPFAGMILICAGILMLITALFGS